MRWTDVLLIRTPADVVWRLTTQVADWPSFLPTVQRLERIDEGPLRVGSSARIKQPGQPVATWIVTRLEPGREFTWQATRRGLTIAGSHLVEETADGCRNTLTLEATGPAARPFGWAFGPMVRRSLRSENAGFRAKAEGSGSGLRTDQQD